MVVERSQYSNVAPSLVDCFLSGNGVLWVGAGPSGASGGSNSAWGVPGTRELVNRLEGRPTGFEPESWDLPKVATRFVYRNGRKKLNAIIREFYEDPVGPLPPFYEAIRAVPHAVGRFVTTNYDPYLKRALLDRDPVVVVREVGVNRVTQDRPAIYYVHGAAADPANCVITEGDYDHWEEESQLLRTVILGDFFTRRTIVMVGYRARDPHFRRMLNFVQKQLRKSGSTAGKIYFVLPEPHPEDFAVFDELNLDVVLIPMEAGVFAETLTADMEQELQLRVAEEIEEFLDPPEVAKVRSEIESLSRESEEEYHLKVAELWMDLSEKLSKKEKNRLSIRQLRRAVGHLLKTGHVDQALTVLRRLIDVALDDLSDADEAVGAWRTTNPGEALKEASQDVLGDLYASLGRAYGAIGDVSSAQRLVAQLDDLKGSGTTRPWFHDHFRIRASIALHDGDLLSAATELLDHAEQTGLVESQVRGLFFRGLHRDPDATIQCLKQLDAEGRVEELRLRALGWLHSNVLESSKAADMFRAAARLAMRDQSVRSAVTSFRAASWSEHRGPSVILRDRSDFARAWDLKRSVRDAVPDARTIDDLLDRAANNLAFGKLRSAVRPAMEALHLAFLEIDPVGVIRSSTALAAVHLSVLEQFSSQEDIRLAAYYLSVSGTTGEVGQNPKPLDRFHEIFRDQATHETVVEVITLMSSVTTDPGRLTGQLRVLANVAEFAPARMISTILKVVRAGLNLGWHSVGTINAVKPACSIIESIRGELKTSEAVELRDLLLELAENSPLGAFRDLFPVLQVLIPLAGPPGDGEKELGKRLLHLHANSEGKHLEDVTLPVLAALADISSGSIKERLWKEIEDAPVDPALLLAWKIQGNREFDPAAPTEFLSSLEATVERHLKEAEDGKSWGGGARYNTTLYRIVVPHADREVRADVLRKVLRFIEEGRHLRETRLSYVGLGAWLAVHASDDLKEQAADVFARCAREGMQSSLALDREGAHPLAGVRIGGTGTSQTRSYALSALAAVHDEATEALKRRIEQEILDAAEDPTPVVRGAAMRQIGVVLPDAECKDRMSRAIVGGLKDPDTSVRQNAIKTASQKWGELLPDSRREAFTIIKESAEDPASPVITARAAKHGLDRINQMEDESSSQAVK